MGCLNCKTQYGREKVEYICTLTEFSPELSDNNRHCLSNDPTTLSVWCHGYESDSFCPGCGKDLDTQNCSCPTDIQWS